MTQLEKRLETELFALQDLRYKAFQTKLMPGVAPESVIGVRMPALRGLARAWGKTPDAPAFLKLLPHRYYEENNLHGLLICAMHDFSEAVAALDDFLPYVNNWATCDMINPRIFGKHLPDLLPHIRKWMASEHCYTIRFGIGMLMRYYLDAAFEPEYPAWVCAVDSKEYYVNMMAAWYFATALAKQYDAVVPWIERRKLAPWTHNKVIQKACESDRISGAQKIYLRTMKCGAVSECL